MSSAAAPKPEQVCRLRDQLHRAYEIALGDYKRAVNVLNWTRGNSSRQDYQRLQDYIDFARTKSEETLRALGIHIEEHGC